MNEEGMKRAAAIMIALGEDVTSPVLAALDEDEVSELTKEIATTSIVSPDKMDEYIEDFYNMMLAKKFIAKGGLDYAKSVLVKSLGPERARKIIDRLTKMLEQSSGFDFLSKIDPKQLAKFIQTEHPQTIALILAHLDPSQAAESLAQLPEEMKADITLRISNLQDISPSVVKTLARVLEERFESLSSYNVEVGGVKSVAEIFNRMDRVTSKSTLEKTGKGRSGTGTGNQRYDVRFRGYQSSQRCGSAGNPQKKQTRRLLLSLSKGQIPRLRNVSSRICQPVLWRP